MLTRKIIGGNTKNAKKFAEILLGVTVGNDQNVPLEFMDPTEAEAVKLFSNTYLAMRIAYFNELDTYCEMNDLNTEKVIKGIGYDPRIGNYYNNPSFGFGGYCLPKDTKQLLQNFDNVPQKIMEAIINSNSTRKDFIADQIIKLKPKVVGIFKLVMKEGSDNIRESSMQGIMKRIKAKGISVIVYEPHIKENSFFNSKIYTDLSQFKKESDLIICNRNHPDLEDVKEKVFTRDLFQQD